MKQDTKDTGISYINISLGISVVLLLIVMLRPIFVSSNKSVPVDLKRNNAPVVSERPSESAYDIDKVKRNISWPAGDNAEYSDLEEMYKNCDKTNVGGNMVEAWRRVKPEDKARLSEGFDKQIAVAQETLKADPKDKHAKNILYIAEAIKKMSAEGFNHNLKNKK
mgnify:CR=1 FL=1